MLAAENGAMNDSERAFWIEQLDVDHGHRDLATIVRVQARYVLHSFRSGRTNP
jgi:hypothetical protein